MHHENPFTGLNLWKLTVLDRANSICITAKILKAKFRWDSHVMCYHSRCLTSSWRRLVVSKESHKNYPKINPRWAKFQPCQLEPALTASNGAICIAWQQATFQLIGIGSITRQATKEKGKHPLQFKKQSFKKPYLHIEVQLQKSHV